MQVHRIRAGMLAVGIAVPSLLGVGTAPAAHHNVYLVDCQGDRAKIKPTFVVLACADGGAIVKVTKWKHWGDAKATAAATLSINDCNPSCYQGTFVSEPAKVTVGSITKRHGKREYGHIRVVPDSPNRHHFKTYSAALPG